MKIQEQTFVKDRSNITFGADFMLKVVLYSALIFGIVISAESLIMHSIVGNPEVDIMRQATILGAFAALVGATLAVPVSIGLNLFKQKKIKYAVAIMATALIMIFLGILRYGDIPLV
ncbi:MAG: hypothetical protein JJT94_04020 [Bernardetiaceae bacterium]|nr:hypothetical protein [Bernardetiaceae bacterium]